MAALAAVFLALAGTQSPAQAAESEWVSFDGGQARVLSAVYSVFIGGAAYDVTRGTDNNIWFRYNGGTWRPLGGDSSSRTTSPPRIVEFPPGRAMAVVRGLDGEIWQCPVVLLADVRSVGVQGDGRTYGHPIVLRPVSSEDAMTADWTRLPYDVLSKISNRITNEVREVNRVVLDVTSKPPGTIEWE